MTKVSITVFTDPACPIALSAEPRRMRIAWLFRDQIEWDLRTVVLTDARRQFAEPGTKGFTKDMLLGSMEGLVDEHHMPIALEAAKERDDLPASIDACRAITAATVHGTHCDDWRLLQALREQYWTNGEWLDDPDVIAAAADMAGIGAAELQRWVEDDATEAALRESMERARTPLPASRVLDYRLADASDGRRRYSAPTWELRTPAGAEWVVPGFVSADAYESVLANLDPTLERRDDATNVLDVLAWADRPLALAELAAIRNVDVAAIQRELAEADIEVTDWIQPNRQLASV